MFGKAGKITGFALLVLSAILIALPMCLSGLNVSQTETIQLVGILIAGATVLAYLIIFVLALKRKAPNSWIYLLVVILGIVLVTSPVWLFALGFALGGVG